MGAHGRKEDSMINLRDMDTGLHPPAPGPDPRDAAEWDRERRRARDDDGECPECGQGGEE